MGLLTTTNGALMRLQNEINQLMRFNRWDELDDDMMMLEPGWAPAIDVKAEKGHYKIRADVPGVDPKDIDVRLDKGMLTIQGSRNEEKKSEENGFQRVERFSGSFYRRLSLPGSIDSDKIKAKVNNGVLEIIVPREEAKPAKRITVES
ncbi:Hsp20/alpha crystallin family protein [Marinobacter halodurans]|uniref:Hsp20/alpha crystallin family protein n=1 Tax=Marinobacter halodurans TaxID=2528979 RepID=A0ABY1ZV26_9GAMM|nr:Hsp20/alpha crystallin family protein [Marinobacter halodurans]TBW59513.1 Hsp20/alpha crystallin family protein [Marinobacter halodurans]